MALICGAGETATGLAGLTGCMAVENAAAVVNVVTIVSIVAAAGFGLLGLLTSYKDKDGRITRWGRIAAGGVLLTALLSITSRTIEGRIAAIKDEQARAAAEIARKEEDADRAAATDRFETQVTLVNGVLADLNKVSARTEKVQAGVNLTIDAQRRQLATAQRTSRRLAQTAAESQANADRLLRSVWDASERISGRDVTVSARIACYIAPAHPLRAELEANLDANGPALLDLGPDASISMQGRRAAAGPADCSSTPAACWNSLFVAIDGKHEIVDQPRLSLVKNRTHDEDIKLTQKSEFTNYVIVDETAALNRPAWNGGTVELKLSGAMSPFIRKLTSAAKAERLQGQPDTIGPRRRASLESGLWAWDWRRSNSVELDFTDELLPCHADVNLNLRGRSIGVSHGRFVASLGRDDVPGFKPFVRIELPPFTIDEDAFPTYAQTLPQSAPSSPR